MSRQELLTKVRDAARSHGAKSELAAALGYSRQTIHNKLSRDDGFTDDELKKAAAVLIVAEAEKILERGNLSAPDTELLVNCIVAVEELLDEMGSKPTREAKARIIAKIYSLEYGQQDAGEPPLSGAEVVRLVRSA